MSLDRRPRACAIYHRPSIGAILDAEMRPEDGRYVIACGGEVVASVKSVAGLRDVAGTSNGATLQDPAIISMAYPVLGQEWLDARVGREAKLELETARAATCSACSCGRWPIRCRAGSRTKPWSNGSRSDDRRDFRARKGGARAMAGDEIGSDAALLADVRGLALALERGERWSAIERIARELAERHRLDRDVVLSVTADQWGSVPHRCGEGGPIA